jgi:hypothetical protein
MAMQFQKQKRLAREHAVVAALAKFERLETSKRRPEVPTTIPGLAGWMETKLGSNRIQDKADVVQVMKVTSTAVLTKVRSTLRRVHRFYVHRFDELRVAADEEKEACARRIAVDASNRAGSVLPLARSWRIDVTIPRPG